MLSVINRGTQTGGKTDGIPYKIVDGYSPGSYDGESIDIIKMAGVETPLFIDLSAVTEQGYQMVDITIVSNQGILSVDLQPTIKNGYTQKTVNPKER